MRPVELTKASIHTIRCSEGKGGDGDKIPGTPMWGCGSCEMGAREERVGVVWYERAAKPGRLTPQRFVGVRARCIQHPEPPPHGCHRHMETGVGTQRWHPPEPPPAWVSFFPSPHAHALQPSTGFDQAFVACWPGSLLQLHRIRPWCSRFHSPPGYCSCGTALVAVTELYRMLL